MMTGAVKIFENYLGKGVYKVVEQKVIQIPQPLPSPDPQH